MTNHHGGRWRCGDFTVRVPPECQVSEGNIYADSIAENERLLRLDPPPAQRRNLESSAAAMRETMDRHGRYGDYLVVSVAGRHRLRVGSFVTDQEPDELKRQLEDLLRRTVTLEDVVYHGIAGKACGDGSDPELGREWWLKRGGCLVLFSLDGRSRPDAAAVRAAEAIVASIEHDPGADGG